LGPIPNPQSPIPNPHFFNNKIKQNLELLFFMNEFYLIVI
jgi:hypothetical protein